jgi:hypothetical protein
MTRIVRGLQEKNAYHSFFFFLILFVFKQR